MPGCLSPPASHLLSFLMELPSTCPWLVFLDDDKEDDKSGYICTLTSNQAFRATNLPKLRNKTIWNCRGGWLVLSDDDTNSQFSLWNPATSELINMPSLELKSNQKINGAIMFPHVNYLSPTENKVVNGLVFLFDKGIRSIIYCRIGDKYWNYVSYAKEIDGIANNEEDRLFCPVFCNGSLYAETWVSEKLVSICHIDEPTRIDIKEYCDQPIHGGISPVSGVCLVESFGDVFRIVITYGGVRYNEIIEVEVFKLDQVKLSWNKVTYDSEMDQVSFFVVNNNCAFSCRTNIQGEIKGGLVYLSTRTDEDLKDAHQYFGEEINHYIFNILENNLSIFWPNLRWKTPTLCDEFIWVMPDLREAGRETERREQINRDGSEIEEQEDDDDNVKNAVMDASREESEEGPFSYLPLDILRLVAGYFDPIGYMNFRCVSKKCEVAAPCNQWRRRGVFSKRLYSSPLSPFLMFITGNANIHNFVDPKFGSKYLMEVPKVLVNAKIRYSSKGWLLMVTYNKKVMLFYNPFTKEIIELPNRPSVCVRDCMAVCFSSLPSSSDCTILVVGGSLGFMDFYYFRSGQEHWRIIRRENDFFTFSTNHNNPVLHNGAYYVLSQQGQLGVLKLLGDHHQESTWDILEDPKRPCDSFDHNFLLECDGRVLSVFVGRLGGWMQVFELNDTIMVWERVRDLKDHTLYLSRSSSFSTLAKSKEMGNKIFLSRFDDNNGVLYYSLETGNYESFVNNDFGLELYNNSKEPLLSGWIEPTLS